MHPSVKISQTEIENQRLEKIMISGATNHKEALEAAKEWCEENNCILESKELENPIRNLEDNSTIFYAKVSSDDYD